MVAGPTAHRLRVVPVPYLRANTRAPSGRDSPFGETCRWRVCREIPSSFQSSLTFVSGLPIEAIANLPAVVVAAIAAS